MKLKLLDVEVHQIRSIWKFFELNGGIKVNDNAKCFIKIAKGIYEEITYKELQERRKIIETYKDKLFIPVQRNATRSRKRGIWRFL